jgi:diguanylate cyclase (GGDEF)-like protein
LLKYQWEHSPGTLRLESLLKHGIFPASHYLFAAIVDRNGKLVSGTFPMSEGLSMADRDYFIFHEKEKSDTLRIGVPVIARASKKTVIQFTRRLVDIKGRFDGVVIVAVEPAYFSSFYDSSSLGQSGLLAIVGRDRELRVATMGADLGHQNPLAWNTIPQFDGKEGARLLSGVPWFADKQDRFFAWRALEDYPVIAMVGLPRGELIASSQKIWETFRNVAVVGSILLFLFALIATFLSLRPAWKRHLAAKAREDYWIASEGGSEAFYMWRSIHDKQGTIVDCEIVDCNEHAATLIGMNKPEMMAKRLSALCSPSHFENVMQTYRQAVEHGVYEDEYVVPPDSVLKPEWMYRKFVRTNVGVAVTLRDISEAKAYERELVRIGNEDDLTRLPNRHWLINFLPRAIEGARSRDAMLGLLFIDLDGFKNVNDTLGHSSGDELLQAASLRLKSALRPADSVVRFGGDEFIVVLEPNMDENAAVLVAERIVQAFIRPFELSRARHTVGTSIGIAIFPRDGKDAETLLRSADMAMYSAKEGGKGQYRFYRPELYEGLKHRLELEHQLLRAVKEDQFVLHYQPRVDTMTGELVGMEALVRWLHPERGMVPPNEFIPLAEANGIIIPLGELVMHKVGAQLALWRQQGVPVVPVSVNVSARQFNEGTVKELVSDCLAMHRVPPALIEIELTESAMLGDAESVREQVAAINALGVKIHIDDFGTGYSSLSLLHMLNMDVVKVDRSFTWQLGKGKEGEIFFKAIVSMAKALNMRVVAEGVETAEQLHILRSVSCDEIQGYFASKPLPASEIPALLRERFIL